MPHVGTFLLAHIFSALLPPINPDDRDYYDVLDVKRNATNEQIRKAYKKKSLQLHPDKIAQRRASTKTIQEAAEEYEKVQEAYGVLVNDDKRQQYHALKCSPTRYQFVSRGALSNPGAMYENLIHATCIEKSRLVFLTSIIFMILLVQPILIATKINHIVEQRGSLQDSNWVVILLPFWVLFGLFVLFWFALIPVIPTLDGKLSIILTALEYATWYVAVFFLALKWDGTFTDEDWPYRKVFIPVYVAMLLRWIQAVFILRKVKQDVDKMVTKEYLESEVLSGKTLEELSEEERKEVMDDFLLVTVPEDFEPYEVQQPQQEEPTDEEAAAATTTPTTSNGLTPKQLEQQKVEASPEYDAAIEIYNETFHSLVGSIVFWITFIILLILKLDGRPWNWWIVFTPIWIYYGSLLLISLNGCLCTSFTGEDIIVHMQETGNDGDDNKDETNDGDNNSNKKDDNEEEKSNVETSTTNEADSKVDNNDNKKPIIFDDGIRVSGGDDVNYENKVVDSKPEAVNNDTAQPDKKSDDSKNKDENGDDDDEDDDELPFDEETFRAFQSAYSEAEHNAMEHQAKSASNCCTVCFQLILLCLVVAKLEKSTDDDEEDVGFNTFWILSPFLIFFGLIFCLCACLIYGAGPEQGEAEEEGQEQQEEEQQQQSPQPEGDTATAGNDDNVIDVDSNIHNNDIEAPLSPGAPTSVDASTTPDRTGKKQEATTLGGTEKVESIKNDDNDTAQQSALDTQNSIDDLD